MPRTPFSRSSNRYMSERLVFGSSIQLQALAFKPFSPAITKVSEGAHVARGQTASKGSGRNFYNT
eukprot:1158033-Pelagomonas_calceolata.AAC.1